MSLKIRDYLGEGVSMLGFVLGEPKEVSFDRDSFFYVLANVLEELKGLCMGFYFSGIFCI